MRTQNPVVLDTISEAELERFERGNSTLQPGKLYAVYGADATPIKIIVGIGKSFNEALTLSPDAWDTAIADLNVLTATVASLAEIVDLNGFVHRGTYNAGATYAERDIVLLDGSSWVSLQDNNIGNAIPVLPATESPYWQLLAQRGDVGPQGPTLYTYVLNGPPSNDMGLSGDTAVNLVNGSTFQKTGPFWMIMGSLAHPAGIPVMATGDWRSQSAERVLTSLELAAEADFVTLSDAATIALDMSTFINGAVTLGGNRTLGSPTNGVAGFSGLLAFTQDATGGRTVTLGANIRLVGAEAFDLDGTADSVSVAAYLMRTATEMWLWPAQKVT